MKAAVVALVLLASLLTGRTEDVSASTNKPSIQALMALPAFTNSVGIVMVRIGDDLWAGKYPVTQEDYQAVTGMNPSRHTGAHNPVDSVSYNDAIIFCTTLSQTESEKDMLPEGFRYALPTQAQWAGLMDGASLENAVTSKNGTRTGPAPVGSLAPNSLGLYDTRGNVWQFCLDPQDKAFRVLKGAAWNSFIEVNLRPEFRWYANGPDDRQETYGFRVVLTRAQ